MAEFPHLQSGNVVIERWSRLAGRQGAVSTLRALASNSSPSATDLRFAMEVIFVEALTEARVHGFSYFGSSSSPADIRHALLKASLLTKEEHQFSNGVYGMLSQVLHGSGSGRTFVCIDTMESVVWFLAQVLVTRLDERRGHGRTVQPQSLMPEKESVTKRALRFRNALVQGNMSDEAIRSLDMDLAAAVRDLVRPTHGPLLLSLLENRGLDSSDRWLRNRIASIVLTPRTRKDGVVAERMHRFYFTDTSERFATDWPTLRGIALALASQIADETCIADYIGRIENPVNASILTEGCDASDLYHVGRREFATEVFINRLNNEQMSDESCYWEVCYLAERGAPVEARRLEWSHLLDAVKRRARRAPRDSEFRKYCELSFQKLDRRMRQPRSTVAAAAQSASAEARPQSRVVPPTTVPVAVRLPERPRLVARLIPPRGRLPVKG